MDAVATTVAGGVLPIVSASAPLVDVISAASAEGVLHIVTAVAPLTDAIVAATAATHLIVVSTVTALAKPVVSATAAGGLNVVAVRAVLAGPIAVTGAVVVLNSTGVVAVVMSATRGNIRLVSHAAGIIHVAGATLAAPEVSGRGEVRLLLTAIARGHLVAVVRHAGELLLSGKLLAGHSTLHLHHHVHHLHHLHRLHRRRESHVAHLAIHAVVALVLKTGSATVVLWLSSVQITEFYRRNIGAVAHAVWSVNC